METKKCPYCGEEILAAAKKCKHCHEWLVPQTGTEHPSPEDPQTEIDPQPEEVPQSSAAVSEETSDNYWWVALLCWIAMAFEVISALQELPEFDRVRGFYGSLLTLLSSVSQAIPDWLVALVLGATWFSLLSGLRNFCRDRGLVKTPLLALASLTGAMCVLNFISCLLDGGGSEVLAGLMFLLLMMVGVAQSVLEFITGVKFCKSGITRPAGVGFITQAVVSFIMIPVVIYVLFFSYYSSVEFGMIISLIEMVFALFLLSRIKSLVCS